MVLSKLKFLHVFDTAGVGAILSNELVKMGHGSVVLQLRQLDPFGFGEHYGNTVYFDDSDKLLQSARLYQEDVDHVIVHDYAHVLGKFKNPAIFYHGSMLRHVYSGTDVDKKCDKVFVSTSDLLSHRPNADFLGVPIDRSLFGICNHGQGKLCITNDRLRPLMDIPNDVEVRIREKNIIRYSDMPDYLAHYSEYWEQRFAYDGTPVRDLSCTALQALSMGLKVTGWGQTYTSFPENRDSKFVANRFLQKFI